MSLKYHTEEAKHTYVIPSYTHPNPHSNLLINKQARHPLPRPNTHTRQQDLLLLPPTLAQPGTDLPRARRAKRMAQRNGAAPDVHLRGIDPQRVNAVHRHRRERLVELNDVDVHGEVEVEFPEELGDGEGGADTHYARGDAGDGRAAEFGEDGLVEGEGF